MTTQMIIRIESGFKEKVNRLARSEGKNLSELVRELLENYIKDRDMGGYIDNIWDSIGDKLSKGNTKKPEIEKIIRQVRSQNAG